MTSKKKTRKNMNILSYAESKNLDFADYQRLLSLKRTVSSKAEMSE